MFMLRKMFQDGFPKTEKILVPKWWSHQWEEDYPVLTENKNFQARTESQQRKCTQQHTHSKAQRKRN
jgi:hypothetical protein